MTTSPSRGWISTSTDRWSEATAPRLTSTPGTPPDKSNGSATLRAVAFDAAGKLGSVGARDRQRRPTARRRTPRRPRAEYRLADRWQRLRYGDGCSRIASDNVGVTRDRLLSTGGYAGTEWRVTLSVFVEHGCAVPNGAASLFAKAFDAAGSASQSAGVTVNVANGPPPDTTPPTVGIVSPTWRQRLRHGDRIRERQRQRRGVTRVDFYVNGALVGSDATTPAPVRVEYGGVRERSGDALRQGVRRGRQRRAVSDGDRQRRGTLSRRRPTRPRADRRPSPLRRRATSAGTVTVSANASDNVGVARVDFYVNGGLVRRRCGSAVPIHVEHYRRLPTARSDAVRESLRRRRQFGAVGDRSRDGG